MNPVAEISLVEVNEKFESLKRSSLKLSKSNARERIKKLNSLLNFINEKKNLIRLEKAVFDDFKKSPSEFKITELAPVISNIKFIKGT